MIASYSVNSLNQYTSRTVPGAMDVIGKAKINATVTVSIYVPKTPEKPSNFI